MALPTYLRRDPYLFFHEPVNADEVPGYRDVITHPMDLGTMEQRVHEGYYTSMEAFQHDFMLVTQNAQLFNPPSSIYHTAARRLETWGLRAIAREAMSVVADDAAMSATEGGDDDTSEARRRGRRKRTAHERAMIEAEPHAEHLSRRMMRVGSARSTTWSLKDVHTDDPAELLFRRTLAYAGVGKHQLTGRSACSARAHAKPKPRLAPPLSMASSAPSSNSNASDEPVPFVYREDGALDAAELADVREYVALQTLSMPAYESLQHLPMMLSTTPTAPGQAPGEPSLTFPPTQTGRPDALYAATASMPWHAAENASHTFEGTTIPDDQRALPFAIASHAAPGGLGAKVSAAARPVWPAMPPPAIQESGLRLNRRERELEQERDEQNWTFYRPHMTRLMALQDLGAYASLPAWAATQAGDEHVLQPYASVAGDRLTQAVRDHLRAMPYRALGLPRTAQYVPRASLQQLPIALQISMQGAQETERLIDVVYGSVDGLAYARSLAEFVHGAAADVSMDQDASMAAAQVEQALSQHVTEHILSPMTGGLWDVLAKVSATLTPMTARPGHLTELLDDKDGAVSSALWPMRTVKKEADEDEEGKPPQLDRVLESVLDTM